MHPVHVPLVRYCEFASGMSAILQGKIGVVIIKDNHSVLVILTSRITARAVVPSPTTNPPDSATPGTFASISPPSHAPIASLEKLLARPRYAQLLDRAVGLMLGPPRCLVRMHASQPAWIMSIASGIPMIHPHKCAP